MKEKYTTPDTEVVAFDIHDVIATSENDETSKVHELPSVPEQG